MRRLLIACAVALVAAANVHAQDDDRVVPAHEEPRHVPGLANEWVRVIDVAIPEGERTLYHAHSLDYPYLMVTSVTLQNQVPGQAPKDVKIERGFVGYYRAVQGTYTHRFINRGPGTFRAIGIELLRSAPVSTTVAAPLPDQPGFVTVMDNERVRAWRVTLEPGQSVGPVTMPGPSLRVAVEAGRLLERADGTADRISEFAPAGFAFREQPYTATFTNPGDARIEFVEFSLK
jgi:quercetin dioxygenase-like cupin family protein